MSVVAGEAIPVPEWYMRDSCGVRLHQLAVEKGVRDRLIIVCGGTQVTPELARETGVDAGFGRGTKGLHVASFLVRRRRELAGRINGPS